MKLRDYQQAAVEATFREWEDHSSTLCVLPTGCGKTQIFCEIARRLLPKRSLILVHREELATQAINRLANFGIHAELEMADSRADASLYNRSPAIVASIQTMISGEDTYKRMHRFKPHDFGLVICDESHHSVSKSWARVLNHFRTNPELKILGVTATPDRADEEALGQVFESVAFNYEILDAINDGWLVPIEQQLVEIEGLDFSGIKTVAGDLNGGELAEVMEREKNLQGVASASVEIIGQRKALAFTVSVKQAEMLCDIFNRHRRGMAAWICGKTNKDDRRNILKDFSLGKVQIVVNVGCLTEGYDENSIECILMARPTKSRSLYSQCVGRATRPLPGLVEDCESAELRRNMIKLSPKPSMLVVDFVGNSGKHKLMTSADILGGKVSDEAVKRAVNRAREEGVAMNMAALLEEEQAKLLKEIEEAKQREAARKAHLLGKATFSVKKISPFDAFEITPEREHGWHAGRSLSDKQRNLLLKQGVDPTGLPYGQAQQLIKTMFYRWNKELATLKQCALLKKHGIKTADLKMSDASAMIDAIAKNGWKTPANLQDLIAPKPDQQEQDDIPF